MDQGSLSRRSFVKVSAVLAGVAALGTGVAFASESSSASAGSASGSASRVAVTMTPGTYIATTHGHNGEFNVVVTVSEDTIEDIAIGPNSESNYLGTFAMEKVKSAILANQTPNVDTVAGATFSTTGLIVGVKDALEQAGAGEDAFPTYEKDPAAAEDCTTQVVVIGSGSGGLAATVSLFEAGTDVILVEQEGILGGSSGRAGYYIGGGTFISGASGDTYTMEDFRDMLVKNNPDQVDLATLLGERAGESIDWLYQRGMTQVFYDRSGAYGQGTHWGGGYDHIGGYMTSAMQKQLDANGIDYRMNTKVTELITSDGKVCGVKVSADSQEYTISCDAVILATGGYASNPVMVDQYTPELTGYASNASIGSDGSGMLMAQDAGATLENMSDVIYYYGENVMYGVPRNITYPYLLAGPIVVNEEGKRFINETAYYARETVDAFNAQTGKHGFILLTQNMADALIRPALDYDANAAVMYTECATLDEVAQTFGIDADTLKTTVETYNGYVDGGNDADFQKPVEALVEKYADGPFYVAEVQPCVHMTYGGIKVDLGMHVLDGSGAAVPGLYAVGECTHVMLNGIGTNTISLVEGRVAAEQVLQEI